MNQIYPIENSKIHKGKRQIVLDTETTGLSTHDGHRIIEVGCIELINRRRTYQDLHFYINPNRAIDKNALAVHGITQEFLADKPTFREIIYPLLDYVRDTELIMHNAAFDVEFLDYELKLAGTEFKSLTDYCTVLDTLAYARKKHAGQRNSLDALCKRYGIDNTNRKLHGALLDAELLAEVYLMMTGGQASFLIESELEQITVKSLQQDRGPTPDPQGIIYADLIVIEPSNEERDAHERFMKMIYKSNE